MSRGTVNVIQARHALFSYCLLWAKQYDFGPATDFLLDFIETRDGGLLVGGNATGASSGADAWLLKLDANGCLDPQDCEVGVKRYAFARCVNHLSQSCSKIGLRIDIRTKW